MEEYLRTYLSQLRLDNEVIERMENENITKDVIREMTDEDLQAYVRKKGDRIKLKRFCSKPVGTGRKSKLIAKLRSKLDDLDDMEEVKESAVVNKRARIGNTNAMKNTRKIEIGWLMSKGTIKRQVRTQSGGGKRKIEVDKNATKEELEKLALDLFFPKGRDGIRRSRHHGPLSDFVTDMGNYEQGPITGTVGDMYETTGLTMLRVYLMCTRKSGTTEEIGETSEDLENEDSDVESKETYKAEQESLEIEGNKNSMIDLGKAKDKAETTRVNNVENPAVATPEASELSVVESACASCNTPEMPETSHESAVSDMTGSPLPDAVGTFGLQDNIFAYDLSDTEIQFRVVEVGTEKKAVLNAVLKRGNVLEDFIKWMVENNGNVDLGFTKVEITLLRSNGEKETGEDNGGVFRDALSEFWADFYLRYTAGDLTKVPEIVHTMGEQRWRAVAMIIVLGFHQFGYFPVQLAFPFMMNCMYETYSESSLTEAFLTFMSGSDREIIKRAMENFESVTEDELMDAFEDYKVKRIITKDNFSAILSEIAHTKLIQEPAFISDIWRVILLVYLRPLIGDKDALKSIYQKLVPTNRRIVELLHFSGTSAQEECLAQWLKRLIKGFSEDKCKKFLRFCTGADLIVVQQIQVRFTPAYSEFSRRIIAHTCGCVLEIPTGEHAYGTYNELRSEVEKILDSGYLEMDIV